MIFKILGLILVLNVLLGCNNVVTEKFEAEVEGINILLSGRPYEVDLMEYNNKIWSTDYSDEIYSFDINRSGKLRVSVGYGQVNCDEIFGTRNIILHGVDKKDSSFLSSEMVDSIFQIIDRIQYNIGNVSSLSCPDDVWFAKIKVGSKVRTYYVGEELAHKNAFYLFDFQLLIKIIVRNSPIKIIEFDH